MLKKTVMTIAAIGLLGSAAPTFAQGADGFLSESKFRFGIGGGRGKIEMDDVDLEDNTGIWEIFGGFEFNRYLAIEAGYIDGGKAKDEIFGVVAEADTSALYASVIASLPVTEFFSIYARGGILDWESDQQLRFEGEVLAEGKFDGTDPIYGVGIAGLVEGALLRLEYRAADLDDSDLTLISLAISWRF